MRLRHATAAIAACSALLLVAGCGGGSGQAVTVTEQVPVTVVVTTAEPAIAPPSSPASTSPSSAAASGDTGSRNSPLPVGTPVELGGEWQVSVGATQFTDDGLAILPVTATYNGQDTGQPALISAKFVGGKGNSFDGMTNSCSYPAYDSGTSISLQGELYPGATVTGTKCVEVPTDQIDGGVWSVTAGFNFDEAFFATS